jgi:hypothetical protein
LIGVVACGGAARRSGFGTDKDPTLAGDDKEKGGFGGGGEVEGSVCGINNTSHDLDTDYDGDGYALKDDCNECNTKINRGAHDIAGNGVDEDCSGEADDDAIECDADLAKEATDPLDAARAIGLCRKAEADGRTWGVLDAKWVTPDGKALSNKEGVGILPALGVNAPPVGSSMLVLSSGSARPPTDSKYEGPSNLKNYTHGTPPGYPKESPACPGVKTGQAQDGVALEVKIRVPTNALSLSYQQNFFTQEYPQFICTTFNDFFVTMMSPTPAGLTDGNIAFDQDTNPISVNNSLLQVCKPGTHGTLFGPSKTFPCPLGPDTLKGTGFAGHAATGWLTTSAPVKPGSEITLRFAIWDSEDGAYDSTVLIDDFRFSLEEAGVAQTQPSGPK